MQLAPSDPTPEVQLAAGDQVELGVSWSNWCDDEPATPLELSVTLPGDDVAIPLEPPAGSAILLPPCMGVGQGSVLNVTPFEASSRPPAEG